MILYCLYWLDEVVYLVDRIIVLCDGCVVW